MFASPHCRGHEPHDDGKRMSIKVERIAGNMLIQHYVEDIAEPYHVRVNSLSDSGDDSHAPVTILIELAKPGAGDKFRSWAERFVGEASRATGHEGGSVLSAPGGSHVILLRFASAAALDGWQRSSRYEALMRDAESVSTGDGLSQVRSGLETWFTLPDRPAPVHPRPKWKDGVGYLGGAPANGHRPCVRACAAPAALPCRRRSIDGDSRRHVDVGHHAPRDAGTLPVAVL